MNTKRFYYQGVEFISIKNDNNFDVILSPLGASIYGILLDGKFLTQTPCDVDVFQDPRIFHGKTIGRVANRIENGELKIKRKVFKLDKNEGPNTLHGGKEGLSNQFFDMEVVEMMNEVKVIFTYFSPDKEGGFPGNLDVRVVYTVFSDNNITIDYNVHTDKDTYVALTNHSYFTLASKSLDELSLYINSTRFLKPRDKDLIYEDYHDVDEVMDFHLMKKITKDIDNEEIIDTKAFGYDHHYAFDTISLTDHQVVLENDKYKLEIFTNFNGVQIYTDNYPDNIAYEDLSGTRRRSIAIEPQDDPLSRQLLKAGDSYTRFIRYNFTRK